MEQRKSAFYLRLNNYKCTSRNIILLPLFICVSGLILIYKYFNIQLVLKIKFLLVITYRENFFLCFLIIFLFIKSICSFFQRIKIRDLIIICTSMIIDNTATLTYGIDDRFITSRRLYTSSRIERQYRIVSLPPLPAHKITHWINH